jgi:hypothetical protein
MKRRVYTYIGLILICVLAFSARASETKAGLVITAPDGFAVSCATGFVRVSPHICFITTQLNQGLNLAGTCQLLDGNAVWGVPTNATSILLRMIYDIRSTNLVVLHTINVIFNDGATCAGNQNAYVFGGREFVATVAATQIYTSSFIAFVKNTPTGIPYQGVLTGAGASGVSAAAVGYYD